MNTPGYCFTGRGAALFRYLDLQSHINTHMKYHARRRPQSVQQAIVTKDKGACGHRGCCQRKQCICMHAGPSSALGQPDVSGAAIGRPGNAR